jgi:hypothetical protein
MIALKMFSHFKTDEFNKIISIFNHFRHISMVPRKAVIIITKKITTPIDHNKTLGVLYEP